MSWNALASNEVITQTIENLKKNGIQATVVENGAEAKDFVTKMIPEGAEVMTMTSVTLDTIGLAGELNESGKYDSVKAKLMKMDRKTQSREMQKMGAAPEWAVGSVHAVTSEGEVVVASNTGSQLPAYAYGSDHVIWVVGIQKIVKNREEAMKRLYEYVLPLESERARKAYGTEGSNVSKMMIFNREVNPARIQVVLVKESLGF